MSLRKYRNMFWVGGGLVGGELQDENFILMADMNTQFRADLDFVRGADGSVWDDLSIELTPTHQGALSKPDYDYTEMGLLFPNNDVTEIVYATRQMKHGKVLDTAIRPHVHYIQDSAAQPTFKMDYRWYLNGGAVPAGFTTISTADGNNGVFDWESGAILQIATFALVSPPANEAISSHFEFRLYRDDAAVAGDVLAKYVDLHYQADSMGSDDEFDKQS